MKASSYQIRQCQNCGLRYPLVEYHPFGERCPSCLGTTSPISTHQLDYQPASLAIESLPQLEVLLDNIRSAWNVGAIFRTADGLGLSKLHLCGITPKPDNEAVTKTSLGAEKDVSWNYSRNALDTAKELKKKGYKLLALEQHVRAIALGYSFPLEENPTFPRPTQDDKVVLIIGNEVTGVDPDLLDLCAQIVHIPMRGRKRSFNVVVAFGIAAYQLLQSRAS